MTGTTVAQCVARLSDAEARRLVRGYCDEAERLRDRLPGVALFYRDLAIAMADAVADRRRLLEALAVEDGEIGRLVPPGEDPYADEVARHQDDGAGDDGGGVT